MQYVREMFIEQFSISSARPFVMEQEALSFREKQIESSVARKSVVSILMSKESKQRFMFTKGRKLVTSTLCLLQLQLELCSSGFGNILNIIKRYFATNTMAGK